MQEYKIIEYLGLASNNLSKWEDIEPLCNYIGKKQLNEEEYERYTSVKNEIARITEKNEKRQKAGGNLLPCPQLDPLIEKTLPTIGDEEEVKLYYLVSGSHFRILNLALNNF